VEEVFSDSEAPKRKLKVKPTASSNSVRKVTM
jgi:hypothetical protein